MSVPGIGATIAMSLLTEIDDIDRFSNQRQFASFLGLIPMMSSSGNKELLVSAKSHKYHPYVSTMLSDKHFGHIFKK
jgi:hypothetical protein